MSVTRRKARTGWRRLRRLGYPADGRPRDWLRLTPTGTRQPTTLRSLGLSGVLVQTVDMVTSTRVKRVGMLAPMQHELAPIVRRLELEEDGPVYRGRSGNREVVAMLTTMGMTAGAGAARRMLELEVDWVMVVGIAGGVDPENVAIGDVIAPDVVVDRATGESFRPSAGAGRGPSSSAVRGWRRRSGRDRSAPVARSPSRECAAPQ